MINKMPDLRVPLNFQQIDYPPYLYDKKEFSVVENIPDFVVSGYNCRLLRSEYDMSVESHEMGMTITMYIDLVKNGKYLIYSIELSKNIKNGLLNSFTKPCRSTLGIRITNDGYFMNEQHWRKNGSPIEQELVIGNEVVKKLNELVKI